MENSVEECVDEWSVDWSHLDASSANEFGETCRNEWTALSNDMEIRERQQAQDQCMETIEAIENEEDVCSFLRAVYFYDP